MHTQQVFQQALTRKPPVTMANGITTQTEQVNVELAQAQHQTYIHTLEDLGIKVHVLDALAAYPDSHFVEDAAIIYNNIAIMTRPGALTRRGEVAALQLQLQKLLPVIELGGGDAALLDGGDVLFMGSQVLIGLSARTNQVGANELKSLLHTINPNLQIHTIRFDGVLHLKSGLTALSNNLLLANPHLKLIDEIPNARLIWLPDVEGYAANTLTVNGATLYFTECSSLSPLIETAGLRPIGMNMSEFRKMDGSFTCLSLLW